MKTSPTLARGWDACLTTAFAARQLAKTSKLTGWRRDSLFCGIGVAGKGISMPAASRQQFMRCSRCQAGGVSCSWRLCRSLKWTCGLSGSSCPSIKCGEALADLGHARHTAKALLHGDLRATGIAVRRSASGVPYAGSRRRGISQSRTKHENTLAHDV